MKSLRWLVALVLFGSSALSQNAAAAPMSDDPSTVTKALYHSAMDHMGFTPETIKANRRWITPELYSRLWKKVNQPTPKGDAPDIEGDLFLDCQESPTKIEVGATSINGTKAAVEVKVFWSDEKKTYTVLLTQVNGAWKVNDVNYGKDGMLTDLLK